MSIFNKIQFIFAPAHRKYVAVFSGIFLIAMSFALYTNHVWEDYYITYRPSKNLVTGHGLVFTPGQKVHTFTSPFNVLIPAILCMMTGNRSDDLVLWLYRIICCFALGTTAVFLLRIARTTSMGGLATVVLLGMFGLNAKIIDFSINGQEIAFMVIFLALTLYALLVPSRSPALVLGVAWAGLMWTRPDSFVYIGGIALGFMLFNKELPIAKTRMELFKIFLYAGVVTMILYLPWFVWAWNYYGSPIPHTVIAKGVNTPAFRPGSLLKDIVVFPFYSLIHWSSLNGTFVPTNAEFYEGWHNTITVYTKLLAWICAFYWCLPSGHSQARGISFAFMISHFYLSHIAPFPATWYIPSCTFLGVVVFAYIIQHSLQGVYWLKKRLSSEKSFRRLVRFIWGLAGVVLLISLLLTLGSAYQLRIQQRVIEEGHRKQIGLWLRKHATSPNDTVFLEPLGYIGYFSQLKMYDFPGLSSPEVVAVRRKLGTDDWDKLILELQPDWVVLRPLEAERIYKNNQLLLTQRYSHVKDFDVSEQVQSYRWIPGRIYLMYDQVFMIFKRNPKHRNS